MADNNDLLQKIRTVVREEVKAETEPINKRLDAQGSSIATLSKDLQDVKQTQAQHGQTLGQIKTIVEATAAGQKELQETVATRADVLSVAVKVDKLRKRIEGIEEHTRSSTHKN